MVFYVSLDVSQQEKWQKDAKEAKDKANAGNR
jgi:hypothetical protein